LFIASRHVYGMFSQVLQKLYRRNPFLEAVPWLMLASAMRFLAYTSGGVVALAGTAISNLCVFLAFLLAARRMIEWTGGSVQFGRWPLRDQIRVGQMILNRVLLLLVGAAVLAALAGFKTFAPNLLMGFDGIAFDQFTTAGMFWSALLATMVFLMLLDAEANAKPSMPRAVHVLVQHWRWIVPAILAIALMQIVLSFVQGQGRYLLWLIWHETDPIRTMNFVYFGFVFGFATVRLWLTLAILTYALREAYRRNAGLPAIPKS
jgi:hypothetical protein